MNAPKKISIITICYNAKDTIAKTIDSVVEQTAFDNIEYIIIDGNSTDGTKEIIEKYKDKIAYYVSEPDEGIYNAMNKGIKVATGDYIQFLNANDYYCDSQVIEAVVKIAEKYDTDFVIGDVNLITSQGGKIYRCCKKINRLTLFCKLDISCHIVPKKELFEKYGTFDESFKITADANWFVPLLQSSKITKAYVNKTIANFYLDGVSSREETKDETIAEWEKVLSINFVGMDDLYRRLLCDKAFDKYAPKYIKFLKMFLIGTKSSDKLKTFIRKIKSWQIKYVNEIPLI